MKSNKLSIHALSRYVAWNKKVTSIKRMLKEAKFSRCMACDWLQLHVKLPMRNYIEYKSSVYDIVESEHGTQMFKSIYKIMSKDAEEVAVIAAFPRSEAMMTEMSGLLKVVNKYLYQKDLENFVRFLLKELNLTFVNITRLDICMDFKNFDGLSATKFISMLRNDKILKTKKSIFREMGTSRSVDNGKLTGGVEGVKFGKQSSNLTYQLYNKSIELAKVKDKPWITDHWKSHGYDGSHEVWRLEFNIWSTTNAIGLIDPDTGEVTDVIQFKDLTTLSKLLKVWIYFFNKYFSFVFTELTKKGYYKKQSRCQQLILFNDLTGVPMVKVKLSDKRDSGRSDKIFVRRLERLNNELRGKDFDLNIFMNEALTYVVESRDLRTWAENKLPEYRPSDRILQLISGGKAAELRMLAHEWSNLPEKRTVTNWDGTISVRNWEAAPF